MTFEEQLTRAFETLSERLRGDIDAQLRRAAAELASAHQDSVDGLTASHQESVDGLTASHREALDGLTTSHQEALSGVNAAHRETIEGLEAAHQQKVVTLAAAHQETIDGLAAAHQAALDTLAAERAPVPDVQDERTAPPPTDAEAAERLDEGMRSIERARSLTGILDMLTMAARREAAHADIWLIRGGRPHQWRAPESDGVEQQAPAGSLAIPLTLAGAEVAVLYASFDPETPNVEQRTSNLEVLTRYAARSLEALTAFTAARALTRRPDEAAAAPSTDETSAEEDVSARRFARLLVSEIKLYHEASVIDGRRDRDLATRLGGEIARARVMYEQRVPPDVRARADFFQDELVRTLADGDASLLELRT